MRATALVVTADRAVVELRPCWLARWFGAHTVQIELERVIDRPRSPGDREQNWYAVTTGWPIGKLDSSDAIRRALDFRPVGELPRAQTRSKP